MEKDRTAKDVSLLIIEENKSDIQLITEYLAQSKWINETIHIVDTVKKAKTILFYKDVDVILIDLKISDATPEELFDLFNHDQHAKPFIVIADDRDEEIAIDAVRNGAQDYLVRSELSERILRRAIIYSQERYEIVSELYISTIIDELTGLHNRRGFFTLGEKQIEIAKRQRDDLFIFYIDLDGMKIINDSLGHEFGDIAIVESAKVIKDSFRTTDIICRLGGDEFVILAIKAQFEYIPIIIDRIKENTKQSNRNLKDFDISLSIGVTKYDFDNDKSLEDAVSRADKEMYKVKNKNQKKR